MRIEWKVGTHVIVGEVVSEDASGFIVTYQCPHDGPQIEFVGREYALLCTSGEPTKTSYGHGGARPGAGRHHVADPVVTCPWGIPTSEFKKFQEIAERKGIKPAVLFRKVIKGYLDAQS